jgi:endonuclease/exonuclease/phosphatase family metal-dependent hydrolase
MPTFAHSADRRDGRPAERRYAVDVTVGTFNLNNLFGRWNLYVDIAEPADTVAAALEGDAAASAPRDWLRPAPPAEAVPPTDEGLAGASPDREADTPASPRPDVQITISGVALPDGSVRWRTNPLSGKLVYEKSADARATLARRILEMDVDVLAVQEVEDVKTLEGFARSEALAAQGYRHIVLVEGNDQRLIDVGLLSRLPLGAVTSWRHRTYQDKGGEPIFSRDLLEVDVLDRKRSRTLFTIFVNHLKSQLARNEAERERGNRRRRRQAETIGAVLAQHAPGPVIVLGDMNDAPDSSRLAPLPAASLVNALGNATERGGPYPASDPDQPTSPVWTHRYKAGGPARYELFDQIWLSADLAVAQTGAFILRRTSRGGDATDHDPAWVKLSL